MVSVVAQTDYLLDIFDYQNAVHGYDIVTTLWRSKFTADAFLFGESQ